MSVNETGATIIAKRANVIGIGMIGGSIAVALRAQGWHVSGSDIDVDREQEAKNRAVIDTTGFDDNADITFVATPVSAVVENVQRALANSGVVTDVASVKSSIVTSVDAPNFVGGHPMAGSEKSGLDGIDADLFHGATWVLTPSSVTDTDAYVRVHNIVSSLGAAVVTLEPAEHDQVVATISHVPHLTASALMTDALTSRQDHDTVLRLAAGGFRDMTRIAAGDADLWVDIIVANRLAIAEELEHLAQQINEMQHMVETRDTSGLRKFLAVAANARRNLPLRSGRPALLSLVRIPIPDQAGALGDALGVFGELKVNVEDLEISHDPKGDRGYLQVTIATSSIDAIREAFAERNVRVSAEQL